MRVRLRVVCLSVACMLLTACSTITPLPPTTTPTRPTPTQPAERTPLVFTLAYSRADSLDPYKMATRVNRDLTWLLYEGLCEPDAAGTPQPRLAEAVTVNGHTVTARLREDAVFSDGSPVTAADVVASFTAAKGSDAYAPLLRRIKEAAAAEDGRTVTFTLSSGDPLPHPPSLFPLSNTARTVFAAAAPICLIPPLHWWQTLMAAR